MRINYKEKRQEEKEEIVEVLANDTNISSNDKSLSNDFNEIIPQENENINSEDPASNQIENFIEEREDNNRKSLKEYCDSLRRECKFNEAFLFYDIEESNYMYIDYANRGKQIITYNDTSLKKHLRQNLKNKLEQKKIDFEVNENAVKVLANNVNSVFKHYDREEEKFYINHNDDLIFNMFQKTDLLRYEVKNKIEWNELYEIYNSDKFKRLRIVLENNIGNIEEHIKYFWNWTSIEINNPRALKTCMIIIGEQGSGKGLITEEIFKENIYDKSNVAIIDNKTLKEKFNDIYNYKSFAIMNEISTMDLKENNQITQDLKRLITDGTFINRSMKKAGVEKEITFNFIFTTNKNDPIQIEHGDRRFTVFGRGRSLKDNVFIQDFIKENDNNKFEDFVEEFKKEVKEFLYYVKSLNYDSKVAIQPLETDFKQRIINKTSKREDLLKSLFNIGDYDKVLDYLQQNLYFENEQEEIKFYKEFNYCFKVGIFDINLLTLIYMQLFEKEVMTTTIKKEAGRFWNSIIISPKSNKVKYKGNPIEIKVMEDRDLEYKREQYRKIRECIDNDIIIEIKDKEGNIIKSYTEQRKFDIKDNQITLTDKERQLQEEIEKEFNSEEAPF